MRTIREMLKHEPKERLSVRVGAFVLVGGWQWKYEPTPESAMALMKSTWVTRKTPPSSKCAKGHSYMVRA